MYADEGGHSAYVLINNRNPEFKSIKRIQVFAEKGESKLVELRWQDRYVV